MNFTGNLLSEALNTTKCASSMKWTANEELIKMDERHAELLGLHFGDGSLCLRKMDRYNKLRFQLRGDATEDKEHYDNFIIPLCNELIGYPILGKLVGLIRDRKKNCFGVSIESREIFDFFEKLGAPIGRKGELYIPEWIKENDEFCKAFLRGFFDTDGCVSCGRSYAGYRSKRHIVPSLQIASISKNIISEVAELLERFGIKYYLTKPYNNPKNKDKTSYKIILYYKHVKAWFDLIGSHNPKHITKYEVYKKFGYCPPYTKIAERKKILKGIIDPLIYYQE